MIEKIEKAVTCKGCGKKKSASEIDAGSGYCRACYEWGINGGDVLL